MSTQCTGYLDYGYMISTEYHAAITKKRATLYVLLRINLQTILLIFKKKIHKSVYGILTFV